MKAVIPAEPLEYETVDFQRLLDYLEIQDICAGGKYTLRQCADENGEPDESVFGITIYTHPPRRRATRNEAMLMCGFRVDVPQQAIVWISSAPRFTLSAAWLELGKLELAAIGRIVHGRLPCDF